jgi:hypothetical protein
MKSERMKSERMNEWESENNERMRMCVKRGGDAFGKAAFPTSDKLGAGEKERDFDLTVLR